MFKWKSRIHFDEKNTKKKKNEGAITVTTTEILKEPERWQILYRSLLNYSFFLL